MSMSHQPNSSVARGSRHIPLQHEWKRLLPALHSGSEEGHKHDQPQGQLHSIRKGTTHSHLLFVVCCCCLLFVVCCLLFVVCCLLVVVCCLLFVVCWLLVVGCCLLFAVCCLLFVVCGLLFVVVVACLLARWLACLLACLFVCLFVLDMTVTLHSTAQYTESTALPNYGLAQAWLKALGTQLTL